MGSTKYIYFFFGCAGLLLGYLLSLTIDWIWGYFGKPQDLVVGGAALVIALVTTVWAMRNPGTREMVTDIFAELQKVTWPTRKETSAATGVVIVTVAIASVILSVFDALWAFLTGQLVS